MFRLLHLLHLALLSTFAPAIDQLAAPRFEDRLRATKALHRSYPWSLPACAAVLRTSESPEAAHRAEGVLARLNPLWRAIEWDARIGDLVFRSSDSDGVPWLTWEEYAPLMASPEAGAAFARLIGRLRARGVVGEATFYCEGSGECPFYFWPVEGYLTGLQEVRFAVRGLPRPYDPKPLAPLWVVKRGWAMKQAGGRGDRR
jgi:hypothetical protein